jgi:glycolate oxidase iron-sulfur subunit
VFKPILPRSLKSQLPDLSDRAVKPAPKINAKDKVLLLPGCVQQSLAPRINNSTIKLLEKLNIAVELDQANSCCGAIDHHLQADDVAIAKIKDNIDRWQTKLSSGTETIISNISGCGATIKDYPHILANDLEYKAKAEFIVEHTCDIAEYLKDKDLSGFRLETARKVAYHPPCTMQHWQGISGVVEQILVNAGFELAKIENSNICCGSAGTYSLIQPEISSKLKHRKITDLTQDKPEEIVSSNIGCIMHLASDGNIKVRHWVELFTDI